MAERRQRQVSFGDGLKYAMNNGMAFYELSAKSGTNVVDVFETLVVQIIEKLIKEASAVKKVKESRFDRLKRILFYK